MERKTRIAIAAICIFLVAACGAFACTTILVGKDVSGTGCVIVGHNEDDGGRAMVEHGYVEARTWEAGYTL
ncbi:MAG: C69 family dipeptidase, partial [Candidatus Cloacimonetes bacterium]|nr:C69 family dipeptidase [Candidatus Cloacimonadota bacterium]